MHLNEALLNYQISSINNLSNPKLSKKIEKHYCVKSNFYEKLRTIKKYQILKPVENEINFMIIYISYAPICSSNDYT